eukprot:g8995.t1
MRILFFLAILLSLSRAEKSKQVTCGSLIKLSHIETQFRLHSHTIPYGHGSGQQSVTAFPRPDDANSYWLIRGTQEHPCKQGAPIGKKQRVRFQHNATRRWLHSHNHLSPLTRNQEATLILVHTGDVWIIEWDGSQTSWENTLQIRLRHVDTNNYLITHGHKYSNPIPGQQEVCGVQKKDRRSLWKSAEGVYFTRYKTDTKDEL